MKKTYYFNLSLLLLMIFSGPISLAQPKKLIHYWHFNNTVTGAHLRSIAADYSTLRSARITYIPTPVAGSDTAQAYMDNLAGDTINQRQGYAGCCSITNNGVRTRNPSDNMQFLWYVPTDKYQNIVIKYETQSSSTASGQHRQIFSYSVDSAANFSTLGLPVSYDSAGLAWGKVVLNLSSMPQVNNNRKLVFRILFSAPNTGTSGNNRFDNITVEGDTMIIPRFTSNPVNSGIINHQYSYLIQTSGSPDPVLSISGNPDWLNLNGNTLSGTPVEAGIYGPLILTATNSLGSSQQTYYITVSENVIPVSPKITSIPPSSGVINLPFSYTVHSIGVPKPTISVTGNPDWLVLTDSTLIGTPPTSGVFGPITLTAANIAGTATQSFIITVPAIPVITSVAKTNGVLNSLYSYSITATGTPVPEITVSGNPGWLNLSGNILSGTPGTTGSFGPVTITASNSEGSVQQTFSITVNSAPKIESIPVTSAVSGVSYNYLITSSGTPSPDLSIEGNPSWLTLNGNTLSGIPSSSGLIGPLTVTAKNIVSSDKQTFYLNVTNPYINTSKSKLLYYWNFNKTQPEDGSGGTYYDSQSIPADYSSTGPAFIIYKPMEGVMNDIGHIDNLVGDTINQWPGIGGCCGNINNAIRTRNPSDSMEFLWYMPTTNFKNLVLKYETELSSIKSGQREQIFSYSLDSAKTFLTDGLPVKSNFADTVWKSVTLDLRSIPGAENNRKFVIKINFSSQNTGNKGNNRFDNITLQGDRYEVIDVIHEQSQYRYKIYPNPAADFLQLMCPDEGEKNISILNAAGTLLSYYNKSGSQIRLDISSLKQGIYFVRIVEKDYNSFTVLKFIKD